MNLKQLLENSARDFPEREAIIFGDRRISYDELNRRADSIAGILKNHHQIAKGDRVALLLKNSPDYAAFLFGIFKLGAIAIPINTFLTGQEISFILNDAGVSLLVSSSDFDAAASTIETADGFKGVSDINDECWRSPDSAIALLEELNEPAADVAVNAHDEAMFVYTSGTTGKPKAAMLTHHNLGSNISSCVRHIKLEQGDVFLNILPMFHSFTLMVNLLVPLSLGARIVLLESIFPVEKVVEGLVRERCTVMVGVPQIFNMMAYKELPEAIKNGINLRMCISGSAPLPATIINSFEQKFNIPLLEGYGLTEASPVVSVNPLAGERRVGSVGLLLPDVEAAIFDDEDNELPVGEIGEIVLRGPNIMKGYFQREQETRAALSSGWLHTGDIGKLDEKGYLYIIDRKKDMLISKGMNVYPREIEEALSLHPAVAEAAVVGRLDDTGSETAVAFVILREGHTPTPAEIIQFLKPKLAGYKIPREITFIDEFPRTSTGKVLKRELRKCLQPTAASK